MDQSNKSVSCSKEDNYIDLSNPFWAVRWLYSDTDKLIESIIIPVFSVFGFVGNLAFLWTIYQVRDLRTTLNAYLANLAACDILFLVFFIGWPLANLNADPDPVNRAYPVHSAFGCACYVITTRLWYFASVKLTTLVSIERYLAICLPIKHRLLTGKKHNVKLLALVWILSLAVSLTIIPRFIVFKHYCLIWPDSSEFTNVPSSFSTCLAIEGFSTAGAYEGILYILFFVLAMTINGILYLKIILALSRRSMGNRQRPEGNEPRPNQIADNDNDKVRNQVARTLIATGIVFFICQLPYRLYSLDDVIDDLFDVDFLDTQPKVTILVTGRLFLTLNSIINPYIYVLSCRHYRHAMKKAFGIRSGRITP